MTDADDNPFAAPQADGAVALDPEEQRRRDRLLAERHRGAIRVLAVYTAVAVVWLPQATGAVAWSGALVVFVVTVSIMICSVNAVAVGHLVEAIVPGAVGRLLAVGAVAPSLLPGIGGVVLAAVVVDAGWVLRARGYDSGWLGVPDGRFRFRHPERTDPTGRGETP